LAFPFIGKGWPGWKTYSEASDPIADFIESIQYKHRRSTCKAVAYENLSKPCTAFPNWEITLCISFSGLRRSINLIHHSEAVGSFSDLLLPRVGFLKRSAPAAARKDFLLAFAAGQMSCPSNIILNATTFHLSLLPVGQAPQ
jgi:hypothetical protein